MSRTRQYPFVAEAPDCYDDTALFDLSYAEAGAVGACRDCTVAFQREMMLQGRCTPPAWDVTPVARRWARIAERDPDAALPQQIRRRTRETHRQATRGVAAATGARHAKRPTRQAAERVRAVL